MFVPKKMKFRKQQKGRCFRKISPCTLAFAGKPYCVRLKALEAGRLSSKNIVACRQTISRIIKKFGLLNILILADTPISRKPLEVRMGKGKGSVDFWACKVKPGMVLFEIRSQVKALGIKAFKLVQKKIGLFTKIV